jgi:hypothetical protein
MPFGMFYLDFFSELENFVVFLKKDKIKMSKSIWVEAKKLKFGMIMFC